LKCLAGKKFDENTGRPLAGCSPQLEGPNPNPIAKNAPANTSGSVQVNWKNSASTGGGLLAYSYNLVPISTSGQAPTVNLISPVLNLNKYGSLKPGDSYYAYLDYTCFDLPGIWKGRIEFSHNANNVSSPVDVPVTISCGSQPTLFADPLELIAQVNTSTRGHINLENKGDTDLEIKTITGVTITSTALAGAKLEIDSNPARVVLAPGSSATLGIKGTCGSTVGVLSGYVTISSNDPSSPEKQVGVSLDCRQVYETRVWVVIHQVYKGPDGWGNIVDWVEYSLIGWDGNGNYFPGTHNNVCHSGCANGNWGAGIEGAKQYLKASFGRSCANARWDSAALPFAGVSGLTGLVCTNVR
jgi:hypothetical protein